MTSKAIILMALLGLACAFPHAAPASEEEQAAKVARLTEWVYLAAVAHANPARLPQFPGHEETEEQAKARYREIARDIVAATGPDRKSQAALLLAFALGESGLSRDADLGPCFQGKDAQGRNWRGRCDGGRAAGVWQMHQMYDLKTQTTFTVEEIFADRARAARVFRKLALSSLKRCSDLAPEDQLSGVGLGACTKGDARVHARYRLWQKIRAWRAPK